MSRNSNKKTNFNDSFVCRNCGMAVAPLVSGGNNRNHCPHCLWSLHVDLNSGDRRCGCRGGMEPISIWVKPSKEWAIIHRCVKCGFIRTNRIAGDDNEMALFKLAVEPVMKLPFPAEKTLERML